MIDEYNRKMTTHKIEIDDDFSTQKCVEIMKPYLKLYLISKYSLLHIDKVKTKKILIQKLLKFHLFNPDFGKKRIRLNYVNDFYKNKCIGTTIYYIEKHVVFQENENTNDFLKSHLILDYEEEH